MPRVLSRMPYGADTKPIEEFNYEEVDASKPVPHEHFTWMNAAYVMGTRMTDAFAKYGWCTAIRGAEGGGKVEGLPAFIFTSDDGDTDLKCPTEIGITDRREAELSKLGLPSPLPLQEHRLRRVLRGPDGRRSPRSTTGPRRRRTPPSRRGCPISWPRRGLPTTSR